MQEPPRIGNDFYINKSTVISLAWDKWIDNEILKKETNEYLNIEINKKLKLITIEIDNNAMYVDIRAFHKAIIFYLSNTNGRIIAADNNEVSLNDYLNHNKDIINTAFQVAVERSINSEGQNNYFR